MRAGRFVKESSNLVHPLLRERNIYIYICVCVCVCVCVSRVCVFIQLLEFFKGETLLEHLQLLS